MIGVLIIGLTIGAWLLGYKSGWDMRRRQSLMRQDAARQSEGPRRSKPAMVRLPVIDPAVRQVEFKQAKSR